MVFNVILDGLHEFFGFFANLLDEAHFIDLADDGDFFVFIAEGGVTELVLVVFLAAFVNLVADEVLDANGFDLYFSAYSLNPY